MKTCSCCRLERPTLDFNRNASEKDGLQRQCKPCRKAAYQANREAFIKKACDWQRANREGKAAYDAQRRVEKADELKEYERQRAKLAHRKEFAKREQERRMATNPDAVRAIKRRSAVKFRKVYAERYAATFRACAARRRAATVQRIPPWFGELDALVELEAADLAKRRAIATGFKWEVDHDIPLMCREACGLHIGANLKVVPSSFNRSKRARLVSAGAFGIPHFERRP